MNIEQLLGEFKSTFLPEDFAWRKGQKEAVIEIVKTYQEGKKKVVILDSPVGSGKSIIAMAFSWIMNKMSKTGYILASDIALQEQYENDFKKFNLNWGSVKGLANYECVDNWEKHTMGTCKVKGINPRKMHCFDECPYFSARTMASESSTSLMNYAYWMVMQNYVNQNMIGGTKLFPPRNFLVCDEGHKIVDIVQNQYAPKIGENTIETLSKLADFFNAHHVEDLYSNLSHIKTIYDKIKEEENQENLFQLLQDLSEELVSYIKAIELLRSRIREDYKETNPPKEWRRSIQNADFISDLFSKIKDFIEVIDKTSSRNIVKNPQMNKDIVFNCLEENYMMKNYFHKWAGFTVIMSATFSDPKEYIKQIAISNAKYIKLDNTFDFSKSPIYYYNQKRMSYKYLDANLPWLYDTINNIIKEHKGEKGIIHTASYEMARRINENISKENRRRILVYNGTTEKRYVLDELYRSKDKILMGPSLTEGLDLKHDLCRFAIIAKVPYLSLGDKFVKAKLNLNPAWYRSQAILAMLQSIGRNIRSKDDWAITYILDASLSDLLRKHPSAFPMEFMKRIRIRKE